MHGGMSTGAPRGNQNAFKHGCYTIEATANRREIAALLRSVKHHRGSATVGHWHKAAEGSRATRSGKIDLPSPSSPDRRQQVSENTDDLGG
jgi:hypothetical protein